MRHTLDFGPWSKELTETEVARLASEELVVPCPECSISDEIVYHTVLGDPDRAEALIDEVLKETVH